MNATSTDRLYGQSPGVAVKAPVRAVALVNIATLGGLQTVGGIALAEGDRVLLTAQTSPIANGIYNASVSAWARTGDFDGPYDVVSGTLVVQPLANGTGAFWQVTSTNPVLPGTSPITFTLLNNPNVTYPPTQAEINALVTIVNGGWLPGIVDRYGTNTVPGTTDMTVPWQAALNSNMEVNGLPGSVYGVTNTGLLSADGTLISLNVPTGVKVNLHGATVKRLAGAPQTGPIFGSLSGQESAGTQVWNGTVDCQGLASGAVSRDGSDCDLGPFLTVLAPGVTPSGIGLGHRASNGTIAHGRNRVIQNRVKNALFISIQVAHQPLGIQIESNIIENSTDNAIDVEGNLSGLQILTITGISKASAAVVTFSNGSANTLEVGGEIALSAVSGMTQINGLIGTVSAVGGSVGAWTATLGGVGGFGAIDSSGFSAYTSGGVGAVSGSGRRNSIVRNIINGVTGDCGIFVESVGNYLIDDNAIENITSPGASGITLNAIDTAALEGVVTNNRIKHVKLGQGVYVQRSGKVLISNNTFKDMVNSIVLRNGAQFVSVGPNTHELITGKSLIVIDPQPANGSTWQHITQQDYIGARDAVTGYPFTCSPIDNAQNYSNRTFFPRQIAAANFLQGGGAAVAAGGFSDLQVEYQDGTTGVLTQSFTGGVLWSEYNVGVAGETQIKPSVVSGAWNAVAGTPDSRGRFIWVGAVPTLYQIFASQGAGKFTIRKPSALTASTSAISAGSFEVGAGYTITTVGTTDFTLIGAANNNVGTAFAATGIGAGTGSATQALTIGSTRARLTSNFTGVSGAYSTVMSGAGTFDTRSITYANGSTLITWSGGLANGNYPGLNILGLPADYTANLNSALACTQYYYEYQER